MKKIAAFGILLNLSLFLTGCKTLTVQPNEIHPIASPHTITLQHQWTRLIGLGAQKDYLRLKPLFIKQQVFAADPSGQVAAFHTDTGQCLWKTRLANGINSGPILQNQHLIFTTDKPQLIALHASTGAIAWVTPLPNKVLAPPTILDTQLLVKTISGDVLALNPQDRTVLWHYHHSTPLLGLRGASSSPLPINQQIWAGFPDGKLIALEASHGALLWARSLAQPKGLSDAEPLVDIAADLVSMNEVVYVSTYQGMLAALHTATGQIKWQRAFSNYTELVIGSYLYASDEEGVLWAFHTETGEVAWKQTMLQNRQITSPALSNIDNCLFIADHQGILYCFSQETGELLTQLSTSKQNVSILIPPVVENRHVTILNSQGRLITWKINTSNLILE